MHFLVSQITHSCSHFSESFEVFTFSSTSMDMMESTWPCLQYLPPDLKTLAEFHVLQSPIAFTLVSLIVFPQYCVFL